MKPKVLVVDDEKVNREFVKLIFLTSGCDVVEAENGLEAIEKAKKEAPDIIVMDIVMPIMNGLEACRRLKEDPATSNIPIIMVTALGDLKHKIEGLESGADEFITKPFDKNELVLRVKNLIKVKRYNDLLKNYSDVLEKEVTERTRELQEAYDRLDAAYLELIQRLGRAAEYRDDETGEHTKRVGKMCGILARALGLPDEEAKRIEYATPMHDIGKIGIPDSILLKPGRLTPQEFDVMKKHTVIGADILKGSSHPVLQMAERVALSHHERWDGKGYPYGLKGEEIPFEGRCCSIIDFFDACTSDRVYRKAMDVDVVLDMIKAERGKAFDPKMVDVFFESLDEIMKVKEEFQGDVKGSRYTVSEEKEDEDTQHAR